MDKKDMIQGTVFIGNINGAKMEIVKIEGSSAVIKDHFSGKLFTFGLNALEKCDVTVVEKLLSNSR